MSSNTQIGQLGAIATELRSLREKLAPRRPEPDPAATAAGEVVAELCRNLLTVGQPPAPLSAKWDGKDLTGIVWGDRTVADMWVRVVLSDGTENDKKITVAGTAAISATQLDVDIVRWAIRRTETGSDEAFAGPIKRQDDQQTTHN